MIKLDANIIAPTHNNAKIYSEVIMAKKGMKRPERTHTQPENDVAAVPELQGKAKHTNEKANPIIETIL